MGQLLGDLQRAAVNAALAEFFTQNIEQLLHLKIRFAGDFNAFVFFVQLKAGRYVTEIPTGAKIARGVLNGVTYFLHINFGNNVERWHTSSS
ncbi:hypothetical protein D3C72_1671350 [compost metagenome]